MTAQDPLEMYFGTDFDFGISGRNASADVLSEELKDQKIDPVNALPSCIVADKVCNFAQFYNLTVHSFDWPLQIVDRYLAVLLPVANMYNVGQKKLCLLSSSNEPMLARVQAALAANFTIVHPFLVSDGSYAVAFCEGTDSEISQIHVTTTLEGSKKTIAKFQPCMSKKCSVHTIDSGFNFVLELLRQDEKVALLCLQLTAIVWSVDFTTVTISSKVKKVAAAMKREVALVIFTGASVKPPGANVFLDSVNTGTQTFAEQTIAATQALAGKS